MITELYSTFHHLRRPISMPTPTPLQFNLLLNHTYTKMTSSPPSPESPIQSPGTEQQQKPPKSISNPRRLLILTPSSHSLATIPPLLHGLTGVPVDPQATATTTETKTEIAPESGSGTGTDKELGPAQTFAGYTTHVPLHIKNRYYTADVPIWVDEVPEPSTSTSTPAPEKTETTESKTTGTTPTQWKTEFSGPEAKVVRDAIGGIMICIRNDVHSAGGAGGAGDIKPEVRDDVHTIKNFLRCIADVKGLVEEERGGEDGDGFGFGGDVLGVIVLVGSSTPGPGLNDKSVGDNGCGDDDDDDDLDTGLETDEPFSVPWWEDQLDDIGILDFEVVSWNPRAKEQDEKRDRYGEYQGLRRIHQILETHDWTSDDKDDLENQILDGDDDLEKSLLGMDSSHGFNLEVNELEREMLGLRMAIEHGDSDHFENDGGGGGDGEDEIKVESMEALMLRMQAIKDMSTELPENERKRFAAKAVGDIMKEL